MSLRRRLAEVRAPDEAGAEDRAWTVVRGAYADRLPVRRPTPRARLLLVPALAALVAGIALTPAGATVGRWLRHALGEPHAASALFSLPAPGRVLVSGHDGAWIVGAGGSKRRLGSWPQASWSPNGRYVAVASGSTLAAVDSMGTAQWTLTRPAVSDPRWWPPLGYFVAYLSRSSLRVVWGNGRNDRLLAAHVARVAPAWRPGFAYQLAYVAASGAVVVRDAATGSIAWHTPPGPKPITLEWSSAGTRLLVLNRDDARVYDPLGRLVSRIFIAHDAPARAGALSPDGRTLALVRGGAGDAVLYDVTVRDPSPTPVFSGAGLGPLAWSPNGRWLLITWPAPDQWVFVRTTLRTRGRRLLAVSRIAEEFAPGREPRGYPGLDGWCCTTVSR
ncbi:MAG TPA: WD40 repeat domain-containing protein [Solirubrobacteraceae bacterium]|nr:WD40 repeat domain-containing protein [Solirubrobacteraceae bacterium]